MLLDIILFVFIWVGAIFSIVLPMITAGTDFDFLPWPLLGLIFFISAILAVRYRGHSTTAWLIMDFPSPNEKIGVTCEGPRIFFQKLFPSVAQYLKNKKDWYYKDNTDGAYGCGGHDTRLIDSEVGYCADVPKARLVNKMEQDFYDYEQMVDIIKKEMVGIKNKNGIYFLTGEATPINEDDIDIEHNKFHREIFETLIDKYFIKVHGTTFTLKAFKRFQDKQAAPYQIGSIIHYVKALTAMKAARVKTGMSNTKGLIAIVLVIVGILVFLGLILTGTLKIPGLPV